MGKRESERVLIVVRRKAGQGEDIGRDPRHIIGIAFDGKQGFARNCGFPGRGHNHSKESSRPQQNADAASQTFGARIGRQIVEFAVHGHWQRDAKELHELE